MSHQFKVGQMVKVISDGDSGEKEKAELIGKFFPIDDIDYDGDIWIRPNGDVFVFDPACLEPVEDDKPAITPTLTVSGEFLQFSKYVAESISKQFKLHGIALECVIVPTKVDEPEKPKEPVWREPIKGVDEGNPTAEFRDDIEMPWRGRHGSWRGSHTLDDGAILHTSGRYGCRWNFARVKDHGPHVAPAGAVNPQKGQG